ncbi:MAG: hypothetical protein ACYC1W_03950 [Gemmatimonadaceae bacterium]
MPEYALYGLVVRCNRALGDLDAAPAGAREDVDITLGGVRRDPGQWQAATPHYQWREPPDAPPSVEVRRDATRGFWFRYDDGTEFVLDHEATRIQGSWTEASSLEDTATYLLGPVLGFTLRLRGVLAFHASAVLIDGRAVVLAGPSGSGKSTTAAAFVRAGVPVLADDVVAVRVVDGVTLAYPSYRLLRLWDESERILFGTSGQLPLLTPTWDKRALPLGGDHPFHETPAPLGDLFLLAPRSEDPRAPHIDALPRGEAFMQLVANTYANYLLDDAMRGHEMRALDAVLRGRRIQRLVPHADPSRLDALVACVRVAVAEPDRR